MKQQIQRTRKIEPASRAEVVEPSVAPRPAHERPAHERQRIERQDGATFWNWRGMTSVIIPAWVLAPLRLFLGVTFLYAGIQKLTDPQFFNASAPLYIGKQIRAFAVGSPLHALLIDVVLPHAAFWGGVIAWGEIAIGLGALAGFLLRPASFFGFLLSLVFFLSASWRVRPYFYGADIVFVFSWITLMLAGPVAGALPALDTWLAPALLERVPAARRERVAGALAILLGAPALGAAPAVASEERGAPPAVRGKGGVRAAQRQRYAQATATRRDFIKGAVVGGGVMLIASWLWSVTHPAATTGTGVIGGTGSTGSTDGGTTGGTTGGTSTGSSEIAQAQNVPVNTSAQFTIPSNGDPGVLVHLDSGKFVAFDATCTHQGCPVSYDPSSKLLLCPCHGAAFDPSQGAAVVQGPAPTPLTSVPVTINQSSGAITIS